MINLLNRLFGKPEEINGADRCPTYLYRWTVAKWHGRGIYLHHFVGDDWSIDLHDHPKRFISIGLKGGYVESVGRMSYDYSALPNRHLVVNQHFDDREFHAPWIRTFPANHIHRLKMFRTPTGALLDCWTLVIVLKPVREWGFWHRATFVPWREYVKSELADKMKSC
jgi:hypothetical protein